MEEWLSQRGVADAATKAKEWLEDLLEHHLLQVAADARQIEFHHQLFQEYYAAEALLARVENRHPDVMDDERLQHFFLNYLKWTEPVALMVALLEDEAQALRVVQLVLDVDWKLGAPTAIPGLLKAVEDKNSFACRLQPIPDQNERCPIVRMAEASVHL